jgi:hypothetical protein
MNSPKTASRTGPSPAAWVPVDSCTLPTSEQPLRVGEFDDLFAATLHAVEHPTAAATHARLVLAGAGDLAARARQLADAETSCCTFFTFAVTPLDPDGAGLSGSSVVALDIEVPATRADVLAALVERARRARGKAS